MQPVPRRAFLAGTAALLASACTPEDSPTEGPESPSPDASEDAGPFGMQVPSTIRATVYSGTFGTAILADAVERLEEEYDGVVVEVSPTSDVTESVAPTLDTSPPDLVHNAGDSQLALAEFADQLTPLDDFLEARNVHGSVIRDTLYTGTLGRGIVEDGPQLAVPYTLLVHGLWYSDKLVSAEGWTLPEEWDDFVALGEAAAELDRPLFAWDGETTGPFLEMLITAAIKEGGHDVRRAFDNLEADAFRHPTITRLFEAVRELREAGFIVEAPEGVANAWADGSGPVFLPAGASLVRDASDRFSEDFLPGVAPVPTISAAPMLPPEAIRAGADEHFVVPLAAANRAGALELLRTLFDPEIAAAFSAENSIPTVVRGAAAETGSPGFVAQTRLLAAAGVEIFSWRFLQYYGLAEAAAEAMAQFLSGETAPEQALDQLQALCDEVRDDPEVVRYEVS